MPGPEKYKQSQMKKVIVIADVIMSLLAVGIIYADLRLSGIRHGADV